MDDNLKFIKRDIFDKCGLKLSDFKTKTESKEYDACQFKLNGLNIISRSAKITPKKVGQFVTFWKRSGNGPIEPFRDTDRIDFYIVNAKAENKFGQFVFPKSILIKQGVLTTNIKEGKRAFRVYPGWVDTKNKQAERTQKWQLNYFYEIGEMTNFKKVIELYSNN